VSPIIHSSLDRSRREVPKDGSATTHWQSSACNNSLSDHNPVKGFLIANHAPGRSRSCIMMPRTTGYKSGGGHKSHEEADDDGQHELRVAESRRRR
jgi:hypothetical protein